MSSKINTCKGSVTTPKGFLVGALSCGIKRDGAKDLALIFSERDATAAGVFTSNRFAAAPVCYTKRVVRDGRLQAVVINSGNANACTGKQGIENAQRMALLASQVLWS